VRGTRIIGEFLLVRDLLTIHDSRLTKKAVQTIFAKMACTA